jgi:hypothetical protein
MVGSKLASRHLGKSRSMVWLGSYIVNTSGCNECHTHPSYSPGGNPFQGQPERINAEQYMAGGRMFGPTITSANLSATNSCRRCAPDTTRTTRPARSCRSCRGPHTAR